MTTTDTWTADWSVSPGEVLAETLDERGMTQSSSGWTWLLKTISEIANGKAAITPETAIQLERALGISASVWSGPESNYRESLARARDREELDAHVSWLKRFPIRALIERQIHPRRTRDSSGRSAAPVLWREQPRGVGAALGSPRRQLPDAPAGSDLP